MSKAAIIEAVKTLDLAAAQRLIDVKRALLTATDREGRNLLHLASSVDVDDFGLPGRSQVQLVKFLLDRGFEIDRPVGRDKCTPLFFAVARARNPALVKFLLQRGAKPSNAPGGGLFAAGWWDDVVSVKLLIGGGAPVDVVVGITPFLASWCWKRFAAAKALAQNGADVNYQDAKGRTALHHGVEKEFDPSLLAWLVRRGASPDVPDRQGVTARARASRKRDKRWFDALSGVRR